MHIAAIMWGLTGVLGALTTLDSAVTTVGRSICALVAVFCWYGVSAIRSALALPFAILGRVLVTGFLLGLHWIFFFLSIAKGGVAIALVTYAAGASFTTLAEIMLGWSRARWLKFFAPLLSLAGVYVISPVSQLGEIVSNEGLYYGLLSCLLVSLMALNGKALLRIERLDPLTITIGQFAGAIVVSAPVAAMHLPSALNVNDIAITVVLGMGCSAIGQTLFNKALKVVPVGTATVVANMEAPYGVILAAFIVGQPITAAVALGVVLVTAAAILVGYESGES
jgi:drug/metabolite transporter (DMT)-like permease